MTETYGFMPTEKMLDPTHLAEMLGISVRHLAEVRKKDKSFPKPKMLGGCPRWAPAVIRRWMEHDDSCHAGAPDNALTPDAPDASQPRAKKGKGAQRVH